MDKAFKEILPTHEWTLHRKKGLQEMRPYVPGEDLTGVSVNKEDTPELGGWIARNEKNYADQWYVAKQFYADKYDPASLAATGGEGYRLVPVEMLERINAETSCDCPPKLTLGHQTTCWKFDMLYALSAAPQVGEGK